MLQLVRQNNPFTAFTLFIFCLVSRIPNFIGQGQANLISQDYVLFKSIERIVDRSFGINSIALTFLLVLSYFAQGIYIEKIARREKLNYHTGWSFAFIYIAVTGFFPYLSEWNMGICVSWLFLLAISQVLQLQKQGSANGTVFNVAFLLSSIALINASGLIFLLFNFICLSILRPFKVKEWILTLIGWLIPFYFYASALYLFSDLSVFKLWFNLGINLPATFKDSGVFFIKLGALITLVLLGIFYLNETFERMTIKIRRKWIVIHIATFFTMLFSIFSETNLQGLWLLPLMSVTFLMGNALLPQKIKWLPHFSFYFVILMVTFTLILEL